MKSSFAIFFILANYVLLSNFSEIDPENKTELKDINGINVGWECLQALHNPNKNIDEEQKKDFFQTCQNFLVSICGHLKKRCNSFNDKRPELRYIIHPENTLSTKFHENEAINLNALMDVYPQFVHSSDYVKKKINDQWQLLCNTTFSDDIINEKKIDIFWSKIFQLGGFDELCDFVMSILLLPNSNANAERLWRKYTMEKTSIRNRLKLNTMRNILLSAQFADHMRDLGTAYEFSEQMIIDVINLKTTRPKTFKITKDLVDIYNSIRNEHSYAINCLKDEYMYKKKKKPKIRYLNRTLERKLKQNNGWTLNRSCTIKVLLHFERLKNKQIFLIFLWNSFIRYQYKSF